MVKSLIALYSFLNINKMSRIMRKYTFKVTFENEYINEMTFHCGSKDEAKILAQAHCIKNGLDRRIKHITRMD